MRILKKEEVKKRIDATGMKPFAFAKKNGIIPESLRRWLNGERAPKINNIQQLAKALMCNVEDISIWEHTINLDVLAQKEDELNELRIYWGYLTEQQRSGIITFIRSMAEPNMSSRNPDEPEK